MESDRCTCGKGMGTVVMGRSSSVAAVVIRALEWRPPDLGVRSRGNRVEHILVIAGRQPKKDGTMENIDH
jgi:hypothetical protein